MYDICYLCNWVEPTCVDIEMTSVVGAEPCIDLNIYTQLCSGGLVVYKYLFYCIKYNYYS